MLVLSGKARRRMNWLPNQVAFGVDCSDSDPKNWTTFGSKADQVDSSEPKGKVSGAAGSDQPKR